MFIKAMSEMIGTFILVFIGTATAVIGGKETQIGVLLVSLAFGLALIAASYSVSRDSGAHLNPAVSLAFFLNKRIELNVLVYYVISQLVGACAGSYTLKILLTSNPNASDNLGQNSFDSVGPWFAFSSEVLLTFIFVLIVISATGKRRNPNMAGVISGMGLILVHLVGTRITGTSVNPARSIAPALFVGGEALSQVWVFIVAPFLGATIAAFVGKFFLFTEN